MCIGNILDKRYHEVHIWINDKVSKSYKNNKITKEKNNSKDIEEYMINNIIKEINNF